MHGLNSLFQNCILAGARHNVLGNFCHCSPKVWALGAVSGAKSVKCQDTPSRDGVVSTAFSHTQGGRWSVPGKRAELGYQGLSHCLPKPPFQCRRSPEAAVTDTYAKQRGSMAVDERQIYSGLILISIMLSWNSPSLISGGN